MKIITDLKKQRLRKFTRRIMLEEFGIKVRISFLKSKPGEKFHKWEAVCFVKRNWIIYNVFHLPKNTTSEWWRIMIHEIAHFDKQTKTRRRLRKEWGEILNKKHTLSFWKSNHRLIRKYYDTLEEFEI